MQELTSLTYEEYRRLPDDDLRYELLEGFLVREPTPRTKHQALVRRLMLSLADFLDRSGTEGLFTAPTAVMLSDNTILQPDLLWVRPERLHIVEADALHGPPDLVFEVLSPATRERNLTSKRQLYAQYGVDEYWVVDPEEQQLLLFAQPSRCSYNVQRSFSVDSRAQSPATGWSCNVRELFAPSTDR
jgi:Uma2 family endonuclease